MDAFLDFVVTHLSESQFVFVATLLTLWTCIALGVGAWYGVRWAF